VTDYLSNIDRTEAVRLLANARRVVVTTHAKPDGDAFGSVVSTANVLRRNGAEVHAYFSGPVHAGFERLTGSDAVKRYKAGEQLPDCDLVVIVDTGAWAQLTPMRDALKPHLEKTLIIDHHISGGVEAKWRYIDHDAAACCEVLADLLERVISPLDLCTGEALFIGVASDTGWFKYSNTRPQTMELAARLLRLGVDHAALYASLEQNERVEKMKLMIRALDSLQIVAGAKAAIMVLRSADFKETGALLEETERFVDLPQVVASVQAVAMVTQHPDEPTAPVGISFRSKPGEGAINVADLANQFGGGGHARAAGAKVRGSVEEVVERVRVAMTVALGE